MSTRQTMLGAALTLIAALTAGCSQLPSAPLPAGGGSAEAPALLISDAGTDAPPAPPPGPGSEPAPGPVAGPVVPATGFSASHSVQGSAGGSLRAGRFTLVIPAGVLSGNPVVTLSQPDNTQLRCTFSISPPIAGSLSQPMTLVADVSQLQPRRIAHSCLASLNPANGVYTIVPGSRADMRTRSISAPVRAFATCQVQNTSSQ